MTPLRKLSFIKQAKDITIGSTLTFLAIGAGLSLTFQQCTSEESTESYEETVDVYQKGIRSYITETAPGEFRITDEIAVPKDSARAIVRYLDGRRDTLTTAVAKNLIDKEISTHKSAIGEHNNLGTVLLYGGMGYMLANTMGLGYLKTYRNTSPMRTGINNKDTTRYRRTGSGLFMSRFYGNSRVFERSQGLGAEITQSKTSVTRMVSRPASTRTGFFRSSGRSFGG